MDINEHDIRTAFDSEGSLSPSKSAGRICWRISICNTDLLWLELLKSYLIEHGYHPKMRVTNFPEGSKLKSIYRLDINRVLEIACFLKEFPPLTTRRQKRAAEFELWLHRPRQKRRFEHYPSSIKTVEQLLQYSKRML
jgi:hypothetical protein